MQLMSSPQDWRRASIEQLSQPGLQVPAHLPLLEGDLIHLRTTQAVVDRLLCLCVVVSVSFGFHRREALAWLQEENLLNSLTEAERAFLEYREGDPRIFHGRVEAIWVLCWMIGVVHEVDVFTVCSNDLVHMTPDLKAAEPAASFRQKAELRGTEELATKLDLLYCLHWCLCDARLKNKAFPLFPNLVTERRRALEWVLFEEDWETMSLDT